MGKDRFFTADGHGRLSRFVASSFNSVGVAPATFGELVQGREPLAGDDFLITLPISDSSTARFCGFAHSRHVYVFPGRKTKALKAARLFLEKYRIDSGGILQIESGVAEGKGLASSSADVVATLRALADYFRIELSCDDMLGIIRQIEPTDGVMFDETVAFLHRKVELKSVLGKLPKLCILAVDEGGEIDTISYNRKHFHFSDEEKTSYADLISRLSQAVLAKDVGEIGQVATISARLHQKRNYKKHLDILEQLAADVGAAGVVNCHSGTFIGLCFDAGSPDAAGRILSAQRILASKLQHPIHKFYSR